ncbi:hypothetical protein L0B53_19110 (plasmid) [Vibrio sp. SS-MA-C1-2]|uniref:hypothetical protein n=1 Tax=Vibrio sp. SS-MA-C1-2 TaxID=2908646 RepID=UPI001F42B4DB|nr:hypothetical protein [Vibrio sp. SS-MA-C1-2]UJF20247.1 hypothetical protein L0B53_19110 [Vibrio sp. SS-MA-C1-2]
METVQYTFRLPKDVVDLIDSQIGNTRTDKLLSLIEGTVRYEDDSVVNNVSQTDYSSIDERLSKVEMALSVLLKPEQDKSVANQPKSLSTANQRKSEEYNNRIREAVRNLTLEQKLEAISSRYPVSKVREFTGLTKGMTDGKTELIKEWLSN